MMERTRIIRPPPRVIVPGPSTQNDHLNDVNGTAKSSKTPDEETHNIITRSSSQRTFTDDDEMFAARLAVQDYEIDPAPGRSTQIQGKYNSSPIRKKGDGSSMRELYGTAENDRTNTRAAQQAAYARQLQEQIEDQRRAAEDFQLLRLRKLTHQRLGQLQPQQQLEKMASSSIQQTYIPKAPSSPHRSAFPQHHHHNHQLDLGMLSSSESDSLPARSSVSHYSTAVTSSGVGGAFPSIGRSTSAMQGYGGNSGLREMETRAAAQEMQSQLNLAASALAKADRSFAAANFEPQPEDHAVAVQTASPSKSPTKARMRLLTDIYASGPVIGFDPAEKGENDVWKPSILAKTQQQRRAISDQKEILEQQIADNMRRKQEEKLALKRQDEEDERRVRAELAIVGIDDVRAKAMAKHEALMRIQLEMTLKQKQQEDEARRRKNRRLEESDWRRADESSSVGGAASGSPKAGYVRSSDVKQEKNTEQRDKLAIEEILENYKPLQPLITIPALSSFPPVSSLPVLNFNSYLQPAYSGPQADGCLSSVSTFTSQYALPDMNPFGVKQIDARAAFPYRPPSQEERDGYLANWQSIVTNPVALANRQHAGLHGSIPHDLLGANNNFGYTKFVGGKYANVGGNGGGISNLADFHSSNRSASQDGAYASEMEVPFVSESRLIPNEPTSMASIMGVLRGDRQRQSSVLDAIADNGLGDKATRAMAGNQRERAILSVVEQEQRKHADYMRGIGANNDALEASLSPQALQSYLRAKAAPLKLKAPYLANHVPGSNPLSSPRSSLFSADKFPPGYKPLLRNILPLHDSRTTYTGIGGLTTNYESPWDVPLDLHGAALPTLYPSTTVPSKVSATEPHSQDVYSKLYGDYLKMSTATGQGTSKIAASKGGAEAAARAVASVAASIKQLDSAQVRLSPPGHLHQAASSMAAPLTPLTGQSAHARISSSDELKSSENREENAVAGATERALVAAGTTYSDIIRPGAVLDHSGIGKLGFTEKMNKAVSQVSQGAIESNSVSTAAQLPIAQQAAVPLLPLKVLESSQCQHPLESAPFAGSSAHSSARSARSEREIGAGDGELEGLEDEIDPAALSVVEQKIAQTRQPILPTTEASPENCVVDGEDEESGTLPDTIVPGNASNYVPDSNEDGDVDSDQLVGGEMDEQYGGITQQDDDADDGANADGADGQLNGAEAEDDEEEPLDEQDGDTGLEGDEAAEQQQELELEEGEEGDFDDEVGDMDDDGNVYAAGDERYYGADPAYDGQYQGEALDQGEYVGDGEEEQDIYWQEGPEGQEYDDDGNPLNYPGDGDEDGQEHEEDLVAENDALVDEGEGDEGEGDEGEGDEVDTGYDGYGMTGPGGFGSPGGFYQEGVYSDEGRGEGVYGDYGSNSVGLMEALDGLHGDSGLLLAPPSLVDDDEDDQEEEQKFTAELSIKVVSAAGLERVCDPYVILALGPQEVQTVNAASTSSPIWNELQLLSWDGFQMLHLQVADFDSAAKLGAHGQVLGEAYIELESLNLQSNQTSVQEVSLSGGQGTVVLEITMRTD